MLHVHYARGAKLSRVRWKMLFSQAARGCAIFFGRKRSDSFAAHGKRPQEQERATVEDLNVFEPLGSLRPVQMLFSSNNTAPISSHADTPRPHTRSDFTPHLPR